VKGKGCTWQWVGLRCSVWHGIISMQHKECPERASKGTLNRTNNLSTSASPSACLARLQDAVKGSQGAGKVDESLDRTNVAGVERWHVCQCWVCIKSPPASQLLSWGSFATF